jgi:hypothetical protein
MPLDLMYCTIIQHKRSYLILQFTNNTCAFKIIFSSPFWTACQDITAFKLVRESSLNLLGIRNTRTQPCCLWPSPLHPDPEHKNYEITKSPIFSIGHLDRQFLTTYRSRRIFIGKTDRSDTFRQLCLIIC